MKTKSSIVNKLKSVDLESLEKATGGDMLAACGNGFAAGVTIGATTTGGIALASTFIPGVNALGWGGSALYTLGSGIAGCALNAARVGPTRDYPERDPNTREPVRRQ